jgi:hypothetical protein
MSISVLIADCVLLNFTNKKKIYKKLIELDAKELKNEEVVSKNVKELEIKNPANKKNEIKVQIKNSDCSQSTTTKIVPLIIEENKPKIQTKILNEYFF